VYTEFESAPSLPRLCLSQANCPPPGVLIQHLRFDLAAFDYTAKVHMIVTLHLQPVGAPPFCEEQDAPEGTVS
jgi:hypothetical protein